MANSSILGIPLLSTSQSAKETTINTMVNYLERAMNDAVSIDMVNASLTLPTTDFQRYMYFKIANGADGSILTLPAVKRLFVVDNQANANILRVNIGADTKQIDGGAVAILHSDGTTISIIANSAWSGYDDLMPSEEPNGKHSYWRIRFTSTAVANWIEATELEFRATPNGADLTTGGMAISSGAYGSAVAANAFDNSMTTYWMQSTTGTKYIGYVFSAPVAITSFLLSYRTATTYYGTAGVVEYSDDGTTWYEAWEFSGLSYTSGVVNKKQSTHPRYQKVYDYLSDMEDVLISGTPANGQVLSYDSTQDKWVPKTLTDDEEAKTHRLWRLYIVANGGNSQIVIPEVQFRTVAGTAEQPSGGEAITANGTAANAFDANTATSWSSYTISGNYIGYDFVSAKLVEEVLIIGPATISQAPVSFRLEYSDDGQTWTVVSRVVDKTWTASEEMLITVGAATQEIPDGGLEGQVLTKRSDADGDITWKDAPIALPTGGTTGQILTKTSDTDGDASWTDVAEQDGGAYRGDWGGTPAITFEALPSWTWTVAGASVVALADNAVSTAYALKFPDIDDSQTAQASFSVNMAGAGAMTIRYQTSTEDADHFIVLVDDVQEFSTSGISSSWQSTSIDLSAGNHIIKLQYAKDSATSSGDDSVWLSQITFVETDAIVYKNGDTVDYSGSLWLCLVDGTTAEPTNGSSDWRILSGSVASLSGLSDVDTTTNAPTSGQALVWNGTEWVPGDVAAEGGSESLSGLTDVDTTTNAPTDGQALVWDEATSKWVPGSVASGGEGGVNLEGSVGIRRTWQYLRLANMVAQDSASIPSFAEVKFYAANGDEIIPADVFASSNTTNHAPATAIDNNPDTYWAASALAPHFTADFGAVVTVASITIMARNDSVGYTETPTTWTLFGSEDGVTFHELVPMQSGSYTGATSTTTTSIPTTLEQYTVTLEGDVAINVSQLADVNLETAPTSGQALVWDNDNQVWIAGTVATEGDLAGMTDVDLTTAPRDGQALVYDEETAKWKPGSVSTAHIGHRYWRIYLTATVGSTNVFLRVADVQFRAAPNGDDLATGGTAAAQTGTAANAFDGSLTTYTDTGRGGFPKWISYDFTTNTVVNEAAVMCVASEGNLLSTYTVQYSDDNVTWVDAWAFSDSVGVAAGSYGVATNPDFAAGLPEITEADAGLYLRVNSAGTDWELAEVATSEAIEGYTQWRIYINASGGNIRAGASDIEFRSEVGGADIAVGGTPAVSSAYAGSAAIAFNDLTSDYWLASSNTGEWVSYTFASKVLVREVMIASTTQTDYAVACAIKNFDVQYYDEDTATWTTKWSVTNNTYTAAEQKNVMTDPDPFPTDAELPTLNGNASKVLTVKSDESGVEWKTPEGGSAEYPDYVGNAGKVLTVNSTEDGVEWKVAEGSSSSGMTVSSLTASHVLTADDDGAYIRINSTAAATVTVPLNATVSFEIGTQVVVRQVGDGQVSFVPISGVIINYSETLRLRKAGSTATLIKVATDEWDLTGDVEVAV